MVHACVYMEFCSEPEQPEETTRSWSPDDLDELEELTTEEAEDINIDKGELRKARQPITTTDTLKHTHKQRARSRKVVKRLRSKGKSFLS